MTSDTKIGLLLGLVFIFVVAFLINGLPGFCSSASTNELTYNMVGLQTENPGLATLERQAQTRIDLNNFHLKRPRRQIEEQAPTTNLSNSGESSIRAVASLPTPVSGKSAQNAQEALQEADLHKNMRKKSSDKTNPQQKQPSTPGARPQQYVVQEGDTLATIAQQHYGEDVGNRLVTIDTLFVANRRILKSRNELKIGQQLTIPSVPKALRDVTVPVSNLGVSKRNISKRSKPNKIYEVRDGDSLWKIAVVCLGNGNRYPEIKRLNPDVLPDENSLSAGMRLRLPTP